MSFTPFHRGGAGPPLVCLHGFADTWRLWELVLPAGGPPIEGEVTDTVLADAVARAIDEAGFDIAHLVGNSLSPRPAAGREATRRTASVTARSSTSRSRRRS